MTLKYLNPKVFHFLDEILMAEGLGGLPLMVLVELQGISMSCCSIFSSEAFTLGPRSRDDDGDSVVDLIEASKSPGVMTSPRIITANRLISFSNCRTLLGH